MTSMKRFYSYIHFVMLSLLVCASCARNELYTENTVNDDFHTLTIQHVGLKGFTSPAHTRAAYSDEYATRFEVGDKLGLILIDADGRQIGNEAYSYQGDSGWTADKELYFSSKVAKVIAYFPYNENLPKDITTLEALRETVDLKADQHSEDELKKMDLLTDEINAPTADIEINFGHAFSLLVLSASNTLTAGDESFTYNPDLSDVSLSVGETVYTPCALNGAYLCIVKDGTMMQKNEFRYFYTADKEVYSKTVTEPITSQSGTKYTFRCPLVGEGAVAGVNYGDFYCTSDKSGRVVVVPGNAYAIPTGLTCQGVVFHLFTDFEDFCRINSLNATDYPGYESFHGLLVSPQSGESFGQGGTAANIDAAYTAAGVTDYDNTDVSNGYLLSKALKATSVPTFTALSNHTVTVKNATSWYAPSFNELKYLVRGENVGVASTDGQADINARLKKIGGMEIGGNIPSLTNKSGMGGLCLMQGGSEMGWHGVPDEKFRPICAF